MLWYRVLLTLSSFHKPWRKVLPLSYHSNYAFPSISPCMCILGMWSELQLKKDGQASDASSTRLLKTGLEIWHWRSWNQLNDRKWDWGHGRCRKLGITRHWRSNCNVGSAKSQNPQSIDISDELLNRIVRENGIIKLLRGSW